jgi:hypothetical protein
MNNKWIMCDWCKFSHDRLVIYKHKSGLKYCSYCKVFVNSGIMPNDIRPTDHKEFDKNLKRLFNTPPLKLKVLKERLKKEREEKQNSKKKSEDEKGSK